MENSEGAGTTDENKGKIVEGYFDISADCSGMQVGLHKRFNKKILDDLKVKY